MLVKGWGLCDHIVCDKLDGDIKTIQNFFFFFQAEDGIRDIGVTGVQTCALPIYSFTAGQRRLQNNTRQTSNPGLTPVLRRRKATENDLHC